MILNQYPEIPKTGRMPSFIAASTAALIGAGVSAAAGVGGALISSGAAGRAQDAQTAASERSIAEQKRQFDISQAFLQQQRTDLQPFREAQLDATQRLQGLADPNSQFSTDQRDRGTEKIQRQLAAQGLLRSTAQGDQLSNLEVGLEQNRASILSALASGGSAQAYAGVAGQQAQLSQNHGQQIGSSLNQQGQIAAQGALNQGKIAGGALSGVGNSFQGLLGSVVSHHDRQKLLNALSSKTSGVSGLAGVGDIRGKEGGGATYFGGF